MEKAFRKLKQKGDHRMGTALSRTQIIVLVFFILSLLVVTLTVIHGAAPGPWHSLVLTVPNIVGHHY